MRYHYLLTCTFVESYQLSVAKLTDNDSLLVSKKILIEILANTARFSIDDYTYLQRDCYGGTSRYLINSFPKLTVNYQ